MNIPNTVDKSLRLFVALDLPPEVIEVTTDVQSELDRLNLFKGKWTPAANLHLTLKFLGEVATEKVDDIHQSLASIRFYPFTASLAELGVFSPQQIRILWIHVGGSGVIEIQRKIDDALKNIYPPEHRFMSHLTIARIKQVSLPSRLLQTLNKITLCPCPFEVKEFHLNSSTLTANGPLYKTIAKYTI